MRYLAAVQTVLILIIACTLAQSAALTDGENLYRKGILLSGKEITGLRDGSESVSGATAACVNCHRPSGMGSVEGGILIPPITAKYLFKPGALFAREGPDHTERSTPNRLAYTDETLAKAIREGTDPNGRTLNFLMPRYKLDDSTMTSLIAYLKKLSSGPVPGVTDDTLHFATIITPDANPTKRKGMLDVLEHFVAAKNVFYRPIPPPARYTKMMYRVPHKWQLHVWELTGEPNTWNGQLQKRLEAEPVFAILSGVGGRDWEPIHQFCQQESIPCFFPNVDLPVVAETDFYNLYFSRGVLLEAQLIAQYIQTNTGQTGIHRILQVFRTDDVGAAAARVLHETASSSGTGVTEHALHPRSADKELADVLKKAGPKDALVLWLRREDILKLPAELPKSAMILLSGIMGGLDDTPLRGAWRSVALMTYPFEVPSKRGALLDYPLGWFRIQRIPIVAEETQVETYIACNIVSESINEMLDNFVREYLVENVESMISTRIIDGYYTRLGLGPGQRFASKGGYIVHFAAAEGKKLVPDSDWIVPQ